MSVGMSVEDGQDEEGDGTMGRELTGRCCRSLPRL